jgi:hypothetical protein
MAQTTCTWQGTTHAPPGSLVMGLKAPGSSLRADYSIFFLQNLFFTYLPAKPVFFLFLNYCGE